MNADDLLLTNETILGLGNTDKCKEVFESKSLIVNFVKVDVMVSRSIIKDMLSINKVYPCRIRHF